VADLVELQYVFTVFIPRRSGFPHSLQANAENRDLFLEGERLACVSVFVS
jgi:hypothetical protein